MLLISIITCSFLQKVRLIYFVAATIMCPRRQRYYMRCLANETTRFGDTLHSKSVEDIVDEGLLPGDGLGAGGLDSGFWG